MRILFLSNVFPNPLQPAKGTFNQSLVAALSQEHDVQVVSPISWIDEISSRIKNKQKIDRSVVTRVAGAKTDYPRFYYPPKIMRHRFGQFLWMSIQRSLQKKMRMFHPDVILSYWAHPDGEVAVKLAQQEGIPAVTMVGGSDVLLLARKGKRRKAIMNVLEQSDAIISVNQSIAEQIKQDGIDSAKLHVVHRGVDCKLFSKGDRNEARQKLKLPSNQTILVAAGRLVDVKGHQILISACQQLAQQGRPFQCHILGTGPLQKKLQEQIDMSGLQAIVHLAGAQTQEQLANWYRAADLMVHPSFSEGIPNVLLEAMSCGARFVASDVGGIPEIADANFDQLVPPHNAMQLAEGISQQLKKITETTSTETTLSERTFWPLSWGNSARDVTSILLKTIQQKQCKTKTGTLNALQGMLEPPSLKEISL